MPAQVPGDAARFAGPGRICRPVSHLPARSPAAFRQGKAKRLSPDLGVFLITGYPTLDTIIDAKQHGATAYLRKPLKLAEVDRRLRAFLEEDARGAPNRARLTAGAATDFLPR